MSRRLRYLRAAQDDIRSIARYISVQASNRDTGMDFAVKLHDRCAGIAKLRGILGTARPELSTDLRSTPFQAYVIFFRYRGDDMEIVSVLHSSRDAETHLLA